MAHGAPSSSICYKWSYDVFLSYRDADGFYFTDRLHLSLLQKGLRVFVRKELRDDDITSTLFKAIHESRTTIILFSKKYPNSEICLQELAQIFESFKEEGRLIFPVYCNVDPPEVWARLEERFKDKRDQVEKWRLALSQDSNSQTTTRNIREGLRAIVERVARMNEKEKNEEEEHDDKKNKEGEEEEYNDKKNKEGEEEVHDDKKKKEGEEEEHGVKRKRKATKKNMMTNKRRKEEEEGHDDTIHVFLSYRDVKQFDFPSLLRDSLRLEGLSVYHVPIASSFILKQQITYKTSKALRESRIAIIVFSKNYATANRLEELVQILKCFKGEGQLIYPVFYDVDPSEVQNQTGSYAEALAQLEKKFKGRRDQVEQWRLALPHVAGLSEYHHFLPKTMNVHECIQVIVERATAWMNQNDKYWVWEKGEKIGSGAHGIVYAARHRKTRAICGAVKELNINKADMAYEYIRKEIKIFSHLEKHPNIVEYYGHKEEGGCISLYMEYIQPGSLKKYISKSGGKLHGPLVQNFTAQILFGLVHLHSKRKVHRDLKPDNLLVDSKDSKHIVKLADFGLSKLLEESKGKHSVGGTQLYAAPEVILGGNYEHSRDALAADIWSLGCVIVEMSSGLKPQWVDYDFDSNLRPRIPEELCQEGIDFLNRCFKRKPADRPSAKELLEDPFVKAEANALMEESTRIDGVGIC